MTRSLIVRALTRGIAALDRVQEEVRNAGPLLERGRKRVGLAVWRARTALHHLRAGIAPTVYSSPTSALAGVRFGAARRGEHRA